VNEFVKRNERLLKFYCIAALIMGWILIVLPGAKTAWLLWALCKISGHRLVMMGTVLELVFGQIVLGVFLLAVAQFVKFLTGPARGPGRLLRHVDKIIYLYAIAKVAQIVILCVRLEIMAGEAGPYFSAWGSFTMYAIPAIAFILVLVGLGQILKRSISIIEESKTLV
jgi:hypothetical protein